MIGMSCAATFYIFGLTVAWPSCNRLPLDEGEMMRGMWWIAAVAAVRGRLRRAARRRGARRPALAIGICFDAGSRTSRSTRRWPSSSRGRMSSSSAAWARRPSRAGAAMLEWRRPREFEGVRAAAPLPQRPADARFGYSFERGPLHLTVIETAEPMTANSEAYLWLMEDLSLATQPWKVVILSRPIVSPSPIRVDQDRLDLAELLAREGVALAICDRRPGVFPDRADRRVAAGIGPLRDPRRRPRERAFGAPPKPPPDWIGAHDHRAVLLRAGREDRAACGGRRSTCRAGCSTCSRSPPATDPRARRRSSRGTKCS